MILPVSVICSCFVPSEKLLLQFIESLQSSLGSRTNMLIPEHTNLHCLAQLNHMQTTPCSCKITSKVNAAVSHLKI